MRQEQYSEAELQQAVTAVEELAGKISDRLDHPEVWAVIAERGRDDERSLRCLVFMLEQLLSVPQSNDARLVLSLLLGVALVHSGETKDGHRLLSEIYTQHSQLITAAGALFHADGVLHPQDDRYQLEGKICRTPFTQLDVLEQSSHQCCASWLPTSAGNLLRTPWREAWNSENARAVRAGMWDGSYRHCNKILCPQIQGKQLTPRDKLRKESEFWREIVDEEKTELKTGPLFVNLAYDRTCNLSCPSCRSERFAAGEREREVYEKLQDDNILPMLEGAQTVFVTGSGDPFASRNFRQLLQSLDKERFPHLKLQLMTNGMLLTRKEWSKFPGLPGMVSRIKVSVDAATGPTHELLRRGAKWDVMLENLAFIGELRARGDVDHYELVFVVQKENFREMGQAVDLAHEVGADRLYMTRISNWGTFGSVQFMDKCVFNETHPLHPEFLQEMQDPRLADEKVLMPDLLQFRREQAKSA